MHCSLTSITYIAMGKTLTTMLSTPLLLLPLVIVIMTPKLVTLLFQHPKP